MERFDKVLVIFFQEINNWCLLFWCFQNTSAFLFENIIFSPLRKSFIPKDISFYCWDLFKDNANDFKGKKRFFHDVLFFQLVFWQFEPSKQRFLREKARGRFWRTRSIQAFVCLSFVPLHEVRISRCWCERKTWILDPFLRDTSSYLT